MINRVDVSMLIQAMRQMGEACNRLSDSLAQFQQSTERANLPDREIAEDLAEFDGNRAAMRERMAKGVRRVVLDDVRANGPIRQELKNL